MARIAGVDIPRAKRLEISLTYIFGIGRTTSQKLCDELGLDRNTRLRDLTDEEVNRIRGYVVQNHEVEGDLRREAHERTRVVKGTSAAVRVQRGGRLHF